jgi:hypothetical protein
MAEGARVAQDTEETRQMQQDVEISQGRRPKNPTEAQFFDHAADAGWVLTGRGWPDFFLKQGDTVCAVEVKPASSRAFRREQARILGALSKAGIPCFCWSPDGGLQRVSVGERGLLLEDVDVEIKDLLDVVGGECEGNRRAIGAAVPAPIEAAAPAPSTGADPASAVPSPVTNEAIERVWVCYVEAMNPRFKDIGDDERLIIRNALSVGSVEDLCVCIRTCEASDFHMKRGQHVQRKGGKHNSLGLILKPRKNKGETQRSRIEWWLARSDSAGVAGFPSADAAIVGQRQVEVRRGHNSNDSETVTKAEQAKAWLAEHGIETVLGDGGSVTFRRVEKGSE